MENINTEYTRQDFFVTLCLTHDCNLSCVYCYQKHSSGKRMSFETGKNVIDWIFSHVPSECKGVEIDFIGGEPLLEHGLIKKIVSYVESKNLNIPYIFYADTNGTLLTTEIKNWLLEKTGIFKLGLSLDGKKETHDKNRSISFDSIDIDFFLQNYPEQGVKMTLSEYSLYNLADDIIYIHSLGFSEIDGVNFAEGIFDWNKDEYISLLIPQLKHLVDYYAEYDELKPCKLFEKEIDICENQTKGRNKWCGIGVSAPFFDIDGKRYPCPFITHMTFTEKDLDSISKINFTKEDNFIDDECIKTCYIYPICPTCAGANYMVNKSFNIRNKSKCRLHKLIALFIADLKAKKIVKSGGLINSKKDDTKLYYTIEAIKKIKSLYFEEFRNFDIIR